MMLGDFKKGERVFIAESVNDWLGVEVLAHGRHAGTVKVKIVYTNEIPGYRLGDVHVVSGEVLAHRELTVDTLIGELRQQQEGDLDTRPRTLNTLSRAAYARDTGR